jgi:hypothetical protein
MTLLKRYGWEVTHITSIAGVITTLTLMTHLIGTPRVDGPSAGNAATNAAKSTPPGKSTPPLRVSAQPAAPSSHHSPVATAATRTSPSVFPRACTSRARPCRFTTTTIRTRFLSTYLLVKVRNKNPRELPSPAPGQGSGCRDVARRIPRNRVRSAEPLAKRVWQGAGRSAACSSVRSALNPPLATARGEIRIPHPLPPIASLPTFQL